MAEAFLVGGVERPSDATAGRSPALRPDDLAALVLAEAVAQRQFRQTPSTR